MGGGQPGAETRLTEENRKSLRNSLRVTATLSCFPFPGEGSVALSPGHVFAQWTLQTHPREDSTSWLDLSAAGGPPSPSGSTDATLWRVSR